MPRKMHAITRNKDVFGDPTGAGNAGSFAAKQQTGEVPTLTAEATI